MRDEIILFQEKKDCCGCGACMNICPKNAIYMKQDEYGFLYPCIDDEKCIRCGKCKMVCAYQEEIRKTTIQDTYVAVAKHKDILNKSSSGGIFAAIAERVCDANGVVYGCAMENHNGKLSAEHIRIVEKSHIEKIQGSKYVQSDLKDCFKDLKKDLEEEKFVFFSGTPCQVASLYKYLGNTQTKKLLTMDIICHGVPNAAFFAAYLAELEKKYKGTIIDFRFRDKSEGWGLSASVDYVDSSLEIKNKKIPSVLSSYYTLFLKSSIYRESCYQCKYANCYRQSDLTAGDYWGIQSAHPEYLKENGGEIEEKRGVSCLLVNTTHGKEMIECFGGGLCLKKSVFDKVAKKNAQLNFPSKPNEDREKILEMYRVDGYPAVEKWFNKQLGIKKPLIMMKRFLMNNTKK